MKYTFDRVSEDFSQILQQVCKAGLFSVDHADLLFSLVGINDWKAPLSGDDFAKH